MNDWHEFDSRQQLDSALAQAVANLLSEDIMQRGAASLAVSGGSTPKGMFQQLSYCDLDWSKVDIMVVDERWVTTSSADSNEHLVRENLLQNKASCARLKSLKTSHDEPEAAVAGLIDRLGDIGKPFSVVVLGMGADGHTASWFPRASNLKDLLDPACSAELAATDPVTAPHLRMTLTFSAVLNSGNIFIHIAGEDKKAVLKGASDAGVPIAAVLQQTKTPVTIWWAP